MNDSRIQQILGLLADARSILDELVDELPDGKERNLVSGALQFAVSAAELVNKAQVCGTRSCIGSRCVLPVGHDDSHKSAYGSSWTDESDARYAASISASMDGRRD